MDLFLHTNEDLKGHYSQHGHFKVIRISFNNSDGPDVLQEQILPQVSDFSRHTLHSGTNFAAIERKRTET